MNCVKLKKKSEQLEQQLQVLLLPKDPDDERNAFLEVRAGTGGDEAALFAGDLFRMYSRYAEARPLACRNHERQRVNMVVIKRSSPKLAVMVYMVV